MRSRQLVHTPLLVIMLTGLAACGSTVAANPNQSSSSAKPPGQRTVAYKLDGSAAGVTSMRFASVAGPLDQAELDLPLGSEGGNTLTQLLNTGDYAFLEATVDSRGGTAACTIFIDGVQAVQNTATGAGSKIECGAVVP